MIRFGKIDRPPWHVAYDDSTEKNGRAVASFPTEEEAQQFADVKTKWGKNAKVIHFDFGKGWQITFYWPWQ